MGLLLWAWDLLTVGLGFVCHGSGAHHEFFFLC